MLLTENERRTAAFERDVSMVGIVLHTFTQIKHIYCPWPELWQRLLSIVVCTSSVLVPALWPSIYIKHREFFVFAFKVVFYSFPLLHKPRGIQRALNAPATPGPWGMPLDLLKMAWGTKLTIFSYFSLYAHHS